MEDNRPHDNLPRSFTTFVGRHHECDEIKWRLQRTTPQNLVVIAGQTGIGKSALALNIARDAADATDAADGALDGDRFRAVVWLPVLERRGAPYTPFGRTAASATLYRLYLALAKMLGDWHILRTSPQDQPRVAKQILEEFGRVLLVVDDLDASDDADIRHFLTDYLPPLCKALVTVRIPEELPRPIQLAPLDREDLTEVLHTQVPRYDERLGNSLTRLPGVTPLTIQLAAVLLLLGGSEEVLNWADRPAGSAGLYTLVRNILRHLKETASDAYYTLLALTFFSRVSGATWEQVCEVTQSAPLTCQQCLTQLAALRLITPVSADRFAIAHASIWTAAHAEAHVHPKWEVPARNRWLDYFRRAVQASVSGEVPLRFGAPGALLENMLTVMEWLREHRRVNDLAWFFQQMQDMLYDLSLWDPLLTFADHLSIWAAEDNNVEIAQLPLGRALDICARLALWQPGDLWLKRAWTVAPRKKDADKDDADVVSQIAAARERFHNHSHAPL